MYVSEKKKKRSFKSSESLLVEFLENDDIGCVDALQRKLRWITSVPKSLM